MAYVTVDGTPAVRRITLSRPEVRNAFDAQLIAELTRAVGELAAENALRVLVLAAEGTTFCAGADFHWMRSLKDAGRDENLADALRLFDMFHALYTFPCPTVARVQGGAYGGGAGLVACCDFAVMAEDATLSFSEVRIGLVPATISPFVVRKIGAAAARQVFLTGELLPAPRALQLGLISHMAPTNTLDDVLNNLVVELLRGAPTAQRVTKTLVRDVASLPLDAAREATAQTIAAQRVSAEGQEGMAAFLEKRKPNWIG